MKALFTAITMAHALLQTQASLQNPNLLATPPMGFNNWARFMCDLNETLFVETADAMAANGLLAAGYNWLNLDDCWMTHQRAPNNSLMWNTTKFPRGLPWLGSYVKAKGFRFGIYEDAGNLTCGGYPGSLGHEELDARTFADWGVEYLKLDGCNVFPEGGRTSEQQYEHLYGLWHRILSGMPHPLVFSESAPAYFANEKNLSDWYTVMDWVPRYGELARHSTDILVYAGEGSAWDSIMVNYRYNTLVARYQRPGYYNDPDFLIPDHPGLTMDEKKSHFGLWASFAAPLIISAYIPGLSDEEIGYLTNRDLIAVDQDPLAQQATLASRDDEVDVLTRSLADGSRLVSVLNRGNNSVQRVIPLQWLGLNSGQQYQARNLWDGTEKRIRKDLTVTVRSHATEIYKFTSSNGRIDAVSTGIVFNTASGNCLTGDAAGVRFAPCTGDVVEMDNHPMIELLQAEVDGNDESYFRLLVDGRTIKYITIGPGIYSTEDMCFGGSLVSILPELPPGDWNDGLVAQDADDRPHFASAQHTQFPGVQNTWHGTYIDYMDLLIGRKLRTGIYEVRCASFDNAVVAKFARFPWEIQYMENETAAYQWITGHDIGPQFLGHLTEHGRVIGFLIEYIPNARHASAQDIAACREGLSRLHALGIRHGDINRFNFLVQDSKATLIDFDTARKCDDRKVLLQELEGLPASLEDLSYRGGGGLL
ncbi:alpha-galactosidase A precursor [Aspergillus terreus]|nr:alpha-galactosidase A precursor [Aspergillus terreus]